MIKKLIFLVLIFSNLINNLVLAAANNNPDIAQLQAQINEEIEANSPHKEALWETQASSQPPCIIS